MLTNERRVQEVHLAAEIERVTGAGEQEISETVLRRSAAAVTLVGPESGRAESGRAEYCPR
jgi:hypothetical protein